MLITIIKKVNPSSSALAYLQTFISHLLLSLRIYDRVVISLIACLEVSFEDNNLSNELNFMSILLGREDLY